VLHLIGKCLNAGVMEQGELSYTEAGTPQGGVISPMLANIFLHTVLDTRFEAEVKPRLRGRAELVRFADDFVIAFNHEEDARTGLRSASETVREARSDASPRQDATGAVQAAAAIER